MTNGRPPQCHCGAFLDDTGQCPRHEAIRLHQKTTDDPLLYTNEPDLKGYESKVYSLPEQDWEDRIFHIRSKADREYQVRYMRERG